MTKTHTYATVRLCKDGKSLILKNSYFQGNSLDKKLKRS